MQRFLRLSLSLTGAVALVLASPSIHPASAHDEDCIAADLVVMGISFLALFSGGKR